MTSCGERIFNAVNGISHSVERGINYQLKQISNSIKDIYSILEDGHPHLREILNTINNVWHSLKWNMSAQLEGILNTVNSNFHSMNKSIQDTSTILGQIAANTRPSSKNNNVILVEDFLKLNPPAFEGSVLDPLEAERWITELEKIFEMMGCTDEQKVMLATFMLKGDALHWWSVIKRSRAFTWTQFQDLFYRKYSLITSDNNASVSN